MAALAVARQRNQLREFGRPVPFLLNLQVGFVTTTPTACLAADLHFTRPCVIDAVPYPTRVPFSTP
jgi:hypothetical protein